MDAQNLKRGHVTLNLPMSELIYRQSASAYHKQFVYQICSTQLHYCKNKKGSNI